MYFVVFVFNFTFILMYSPRIRATDHRERRARNADLRGGAGAHGPGPRQAEVRTHDDRRGVSPQEA